MHDGVRRRKLLPDVLRKKEDIILSDTNFARDTCFFLVLEEFLFIFTHFQQTSIFPLVRRYNLAEHHSATRSSSYAISLRIHAAAITDRVDAPN